MLTLHILSNAASPRVALVRSPATTAPAQAPSLVIADRFPIAVYLVDGQGGYSAESGDTSDYAISVAVGELGETPIAFADSFAQTADTNGWDGFLSLATSEAAAALSTGASLFLEVELTGPNSLRRTVLQIPVVLSGQVIDGESFPSVELPEAVLTPAETPLTSTRIPFANALARLVDSASLVWLEATRRLGLGTSSPAVRLDSRNVGDEDVIHRLYTTNAGRRSILQARNDSDSTNKILALIANGAEVAGNTCGVANANSTQLVNTSSASPMVIGNGLASPVVFGTNNLERARITGSGGNLNIGTTDSPASFARGIQLATGTAPTANPAAGTAAIWFDGSDLKIRIGATTYTLTKS